MKHNPKQVVKKCFEFLEIDSENIQINLKQHRNKTQNVNFLGRKFNRIFKKLDYSGLGFMAPSLVRNFIQEHTMNSHKSIPKTPEKEIGFLCNYFADKNRNLANLTGLSLSEWQS